MEGFAILKVDTGFEIVPHASDDDTGMVPQPMRDGRRWWKWTHDKSTAERLVERITSWRASKGLKTETTTASTRATKKGRE